MPELETDTISDSLLCSGSPSQRNLTAFTGLLSEAFAGWLSSLLGPGDCFPLILFVAGLLVLLLALPAFCRLCSSCLKITWKSVFSTGSVFSPVFILLFFFLSQALYSCKLFTICLTSEPVSFGQASLKASLSSGFLLLLAPNHRVKKVTSLLQAWYTSVGKSATVQCGIDPLIKADKAFTWSFASGKMILEAMAI